MLHPVIFALFGALTLLIGLLTSTIGRQNVLTLDFGFLKRKQLILLLSTGEARIIGGAHQWD